MNPQEIIDAMNQWASSFSESTSESICALYDEHASLWGTLSPVKRDNADLIKRYFDQIFTYQTRHVSINDSTVRLFGNMAICNGQYTFRWFKDGAEVNTVARFSFAYTKQCDQWLIVEHHSSAMPSAEFDHNGAPSIK